MTNNNIYKISNLFLNISFIKFRMYLWSDVFLYWCCHKVCTFYKYTNTLLLIFKLFCQLFTMSYFQKHTFQTSFDIILLETNAMCITPRHIGTTNDSILCYLCTNLPVTSLQNTNGLTHQCGRVLRCTLNHDVIHSCVIITSIVCLRQTNIYQLNICLLKCLHIEL